MMTLLPSVLTRHNLTLQFPVKNSCFSQCFRPVAPFRGQDRKGQHRAGGIWFSL